MASKKFKEVATPAVQHRGSVEESFGSKPPIISIGGGEMHTFGYKPNAGVWPTNVVSPDVKTGYPRDFEKKTRGPLPGKG
jgi:hypothetical protein